MELMTEGQAKTKRCKKREEIQKLHQIIFAVEKREYIPVNPVDINCEGRTCAYWNQTDQIRPVSSDELDEEGTFLPEYLGYCGVAPPVEALGFGLNNHGF